MRTRHAYAHAQCLSSGGHVAVCQSAPVLSHRSQVDHTDFEGRLILADAMCYAQQVCKPRALLDMATLTCRYKGMDKLF